MTLVRYFGLEYALIPKLVSNFQGLNTPSVRSRTHRQAWGASGWLGMRRGGVRGVRGSQVAERGPRGVRDFEKGEGRQNCEDPEGFCASFSYVGEPWVTFLEG